MRFRLKNRGGMVERVTGTDLVLDIFIYALLILATFIFLVPLWHVIMASFSEGRQLLAHSGIAWIPQVSEGAGWNLEGYKLVFTYDGVLTGYLNTIFYVVASTLLGLVLNVMGGYVMSRHSMLQPFFVVYVLITMLFSGGLIPTYIVVRNLGLVETRWAVVFLMCTNAIYMMLAMNAFNGVNKATVEAAEIDGAGHFRIMFKVMLPQCVSMFAVVILFTVVGIWNSWFESSIYTPFHRELWPLQLWINEIKAQTAGFAQEQNPDWNKYILTYSVIVIATAPILLIATIFQKWVEKGVVLGGVKE